MLLLQLLKRTGYNVSNFGKLETTRDAKSLNKAHVTTWEDILYFPLSVIWYYLFQYLIRYVLVDFKILYIYCEKLKHK